MITEFPFAVASDGLPDASATEYRGTFDAPMEGDYGFALDGTNSTQVLVDDELIVDDAGLHGARAEGTAHLTAGVHVVSITSDVVSSPDWSIALRMPGSDWKLADGSEFRPVTMPYVQQASVTFAPDERWGEGLRVEGLDTDTVGADHAHAGDDDAR